jgi:hypothetical protein
MSVSVMEIGVVRVRVVQPRVDMAVRMRVAGRRFRHFGHSVAERA